MSLRYAERCASSQTGVAGHLVGQRRLAAGMPFQLPFALHRLHIAGLRYG